MYVKKEVNTSCLIVYSTQYHNVFDYMVSVVLVNLAS